MDQTSCSWCGAGRCATLPSAGLTTTYVICVYPWLDHVTGFSSGSGLSIGLLRRIILVIDAVTVKMWAAGCPAASRSDEAECV